MCWKQEWAAAIGNLERAIVHVERAKVKLEKRFERNATSLERLQESKKYSGPKSLAPVERLIAFNESGIRNCEEVIDTLQTVQRRLHRMIKTYGIKRRPSGSARVKKILEQTFKEAES
jgi:hypothetical protein